MADTPQNCTAPVSGVSDLAVWRAVATSGDAAEAVNVAPYLLSFRGGTTVVPVSSRAWAQAAPERLHLEPGTGPLLFDVVLNPEMDKLSISKPALLLVVLGCLLVGAVAGAWLGA